MHIPLVGGIILNLPSGHVAIHRSDPAGDVDDSLSRLLVPAHVSHTYAVV